MQRFTEKIALSCLYGKACSYNQWQVSSAKIKIKKCPWIRPVQEAIKINVELNNTKVKNVVNSAGLSLDWDLLLLWTFCFWTGNTELQMCWCTYFVSFRQSMASCIYHTHESGVNVFSFNS